MGSMLQLELQLFHFVGSEFLEDNFNT